MPAVASGKADAMYDHVEVPLQHREVPFQDKPDAGVLPVVAAVESVRFLRERIELLPTTSPDERDQLRHELALLRHWLSAAEAESGEYESVIDGLGRFATESEALLAAASG